MITQDKSKELEVITSEDEKASGKQSVAAKSPMPKDCISYTITPMTIPGILSSHNQDAIDWSANGLIAYGCQNVVVIVDTNCSSINHSQSLHRHQQSVSMVRWSPRDSSLDLASVDIGGTIIVWNVLEGSPLTVILPTLDTKSIGYMNWICLDKKQDDQHKKETLNVQHIFGSQSSALIKNEDQTLASFLLAFYYSSNSFVLYDTEHGDAITKWQGSYRISNISLNPFFQYNRYCEGDNDGHLLLLGLLPSASQAAEGRIFLALAKLNESDFQRDNSLKEPKKAIFNFNVYSLHNSQSDKSNVRSNGLDVITKVNTPRVSSLLCSFPEANNNVSQSNSSFENYIQLEHHRSMRNQIFIVFSRDIYLVDLSIQTIINVIPIERNCSKIVKIFPCSHRNAFYAIHETGNVSFRLYQKKIIHDRSNLKLDSSSTNTGKEDLDLLSNGGDEDDLASVAPSSFLNVGYINLCQSEAIRLTKKNKIYGYTMSSFNESCIAFLLNSGRIVIKTLVCQRMSECEQSTTKVDKMINQSIVLPSLGDLIKPQDYQLGAFLLSSDSMPSSAERRRKPMDSIQYKLLVTNFLSSLNATPTVVRMCPPLTMQNYHDHRPLLAVGDALGLIQIWLLKDNASSLYREFSVHSYSVAGIEWTGLDSLVSFSYPTISSPSHHSGAALMSIVTGSGSSSGKVTNELSHINIETGKVTPFRTNRVNDSSPIETIRVSHLKQYLIVLFKRDDPFEIWDVRTFQLLRVMSNSLNNITAVEWSPLYTKKKASKNAQVSDSDSSQKPSVYLPSKENFIVTNRNLFHYSIEGNILRELACIPPDSESGHVSVTSIAWKSDRVLLGDASGTINIWDLKSKVSMTESTFRTYIRKIRFGPGRGNMKCLVLYADFGVDIFEINNFRVVAQLKYPRDVGFKIIDIDWATWENPILCTAEGFVFVSDLKLKTFSSPVLFANPNKTELGLFFKHLVEPRIDCTQAKQGYNVFLMSPEDRKHFYAHSLFNLPEKIKQEDEDNKSIKSDEDEPSVAEAVNRIDLERYIEQQALSAKLFANTSDYDFWSIVASILFGEELDSRLDLYLDANHFRHLQQERLLLLESNRKTYSHASYAYQLNLRLQNFQRAVQILLETEAFEHTGEELKSNCNGSSTFYVDALKACLIASLQTDAATAQLAVNNKSSINRVKSPSPKIIETSDDQSGGDVLSDNDASLSDDRLVSGGSGTSHQTKEAVAPVVKLVATNLIANGHTAEGVELLNFISKTADSCRYLQSAEQWLESIWLAKMSLEANECTEVMRRWCDYLLSSKKTRDQQTVAKVYLSRRQFSRVLRCLDQLDDLKAFPFALVCIGAQLIDLQSNRELLQSIYNKFVAFFLKDKAGEELQDDETIKMLSNIWFAELG